MGADDLSPAMKAYVRWEEVHVSGDKGRRVVHYYLKDANGGSDLAVIGREKSARHMSYDISRYFLSHLCAVASVSSASLSPSSSSSFSPYDLPIKLRSRREVVDWLSSLVSDSLSYGSSGMVDRYSGDEDAFVGDFSLSKGLASGKMRHSSKSFSWLGSASICRKRRKHYGSFCRNGILISVHDFVYVMGEENKRLVAYIEDLYEDLKSNNMVCVRWFHKVDEVGIILPPDTDDREIFLTLCLQDLSVECIDGLAAVLSTQHFEKYLNEARKCAWEPYLCRREIDNDDVKPFDITQVQGYWNQEHLRYMFTFAPKLRLKLTSADGSSFHEIGNGGRLPCWPKRKNELNSFAEDAVGTSRKKLRRLVTEAEKENHGVCIPRKEAFKLKFQQQLSAGCQVEVLSQDSGIRGCWFRCMVLKRTKDKVKVQYKDVLDADGTGNLEEWLLASRVANNDALNIRLSGRAMVRPHPSPVGKVSSGFNVGSVVDAWWHDGWWEGIVFHRKSDHEIHVYFPGECQTAVFNQGELRHSQEWIGSKWNLLKVRPDIVNSVLTKKEFQMHESKCVIPKSPTHQYQTPVPGRGCMSSDGKASCGNLDLNEEFPDKREKKELQNLAEDSAFRLLKWGLSRKRCRTTNGKIRLKFKRQRNGGSSSDSSGSSQNNAEDSSVSFQFSLPKSLTADPDNCKISGDSLFNPPLAVSNLVMTR